MKVQVIPERCQGHGLCALIAPDVFLQRVEDGHSSVDLAAVTPERYAAIREAQATCPGGAIEITDDEGDV
jgi:ferredoxin